MIRNIFWYFYLILQTKKNREKIFSDKFIFKRWNQFLDLKFVGSPSIYIIAVSGSSSSSSSSSS